MIAVSDTTKAINLLFRPIGFRCPQGKQATLEEIKRWKEKDNPNVIQQQSYLTIGSSITTALGAIIGIIGFKKDSGLGKWFGGILSLCGIVGSVVGGCMGIDLKTPEAANGAKLEPEKTDKEKFLERLGTIKRESGLSNKFDRYHDSEIDPDHWGGKYVKEINLLLGGFEQQNIAKWLDEVMVYEKMTNENFTRLRMEEREVIHSAVLCSAITGDKDRAEKLFKQIEDSTLHQDVRECCFLGLALREVFVQKDSKTTLNFIDLLSNKDTFIRINSVIALGKIKDKKAIEPLSKLMDDTAIEVAAEATKALGKIREPEAISVLAKFSIHGRNNYSSANYDRTRGEIVEYIDVAAIAKKILEGNKDYIIECLIEGQLGKGEAFLAALPGEIKNEEIKQQAIQWSTEAINKYISGEMKELPKTEIKVFSVLNPTQAVEYFLQQIDKYNNGGNYPSGFLGALSLSRVSQEDRSKIENSVIAIVKRYKPGERKNKLPQEIRSDLESLIGEDISRMSEIWYGP